MWCRKTKTRPERRYIRRRVPRTSSMAATVRRARHRAGRQFFSDVPHSRLPIRRRRRRTSLIITNLYASATPWYRVICFRIECATRKIATVQGNRIKNDYRSINVSLKNGKHSDRRLYRRRVELSLNCTISSEVPAHVCATSLRSEGGRGRSRD